MKRQYYLYLGLIFVAASLFPSLAFAQNIFDYNGITYKVLKDADEATTFGTVAVTTKSNGFYEGTITIPNAVKQSNDEYADAYKVVAIDDYAFKGSPTITKVVLPMTIESIGNGAFEECSQLTQIDIPEGNLTQIGENAFASSGLKSIKLPNGITNLPQFAFKECRDLEQITLPESLTKIGMSTFLNCRSLKTIELPKNLREIEAGAFSGCGLTKIQIPDNVTTIPMLVFNNCRNLQQITLPKSLLKIGYGAFSICASLKTIELPQNLREIESSVFQGCGLTSIHLPDKVTNIPSFVFEACFELEEVMLSPNTLSIKEYAFAYCGHLSRINKPETLKSVDENAFMECINIPDYYLSETELQAKNRLNDDEYLEYKKSREESFQKIKKGYWKSEW